MTSLNLSFVSYVVFHSKNIGVHKLVRKYSIRNFPENRYHVIGVRLGDAQDFFSSYKSYV